MARPKLIGLLAIALTSLQACGDDLNILDLDDIPDFESWDKLDPGETKKLAGAIKAIDFEKDTNTGKILDTDPVENDTALLTYGLDDGGDVKKLEVDATDLDVDVDFDPDEIDDEDILVLADDGDDDGLVHLIGDDDADALLAERA